MELGQPISTDVGSAINCCAEIGMVIIKVFILFFIHLLSAVGHSGCGNASEVPRFCPLSPSALVILCCLIAQHCAIFYFFWSLASIPVFHVNATEVEIHRTQWYVLPRVLQTIEGRQQGDLFASCDTSAAV